MSSERTATLLERAIARSQQGSLTPVTVMWTLGASEIVLISEGPAEPGVLPNHPLLLEDGASMLVAAFTHLDHAEPFLTTGRTPVTLSGMSVLSRLPDGIGVKVNPGSRLGIEIPPSGVQAFVGDVRSTRLDGA